MPSPIIRKGPPKGGFTGIGPVKKAGDGGKVDGLVVNGSSFPADSFVGSYMTGEGTAQGDIAILEPNIKPGTLKALVVQNNILNQCVEVMEVNVDGTGHTIELNEGAAENEKEKQVLIDFFNEPYPGKSMISIRRDLRRDLEDTGCGYMEVLRSVAGEVVGLNYLEAESTRLVRLDAPVMVEKSIQRAGKEMKITISVRERRFVRIVNGVKTYFREFGASRDLDRDTGKWAEKGQTLPAERRASEVMYFTVNKEPKTPYGTPRWINQLPSVLGSRKAEEHNLDFFDAGGLPPVLVLVQGGYLGNGVKKDLQAHLGGTGSKHRAAIVEAIAASGSLDNAGTVKVTVERFGAERQSDSMFQKYDEKCEEHVRTAFRLPPMFIGRSSDYNFATAATAYMTAEAQVFAPERREFDDRMQEIVKALGVKNYRFKSKPMTLTDIANQVAVITLALSTKIVEPESAMKELNKLAGLSMTYKEPPDPIDMAKAMAEAKFPTSDPNAKPGQQDPAANDPKAKPGTDPNANQNPQPQEPPAKQRATKMEADALYQLVVKWGSCLGLFGASPLPEAEQVAVRDQVSKLEGDDLKAFNEVLASAALNTVSADIQGLAQLCGCAAEAFVEDEVAA